MDLEEGQFRRPYQPPFPFHQYPLHHPFIHRICIIFLQPMQTISKQWDQGKIWLIRTIFAVILWSSTLHPIHNWHHNHVAIFWNICLFIVFTSIELLFHFSSSTTSYHHSSSNTHHQNSSSSSTGDTNVSSNMLQQAAHGQQSHGQHHQNHPNQHHPQQHSSYHLNPNNSNLIGGASDGGMFNEREAHSMLESVVKGNQNNRRFVG